VCTVWFYPGKLARVAMLLFTLVCVCVCVSIKPIHQSIHHSIHQSINPSSHQSIHPSIQPAFDEHNEPLAIKIAKDASCLKEVKVMRALCHTNIVSFYDAVRTTSGMLRFAFMLGNIVLLCCVMSVLCLCCCCVCVVFVLCLCHRVLYRHGVHIRRVVE